MSDCTKCGEPMEDHEVTQRNARGHKCPIEKNTSSRSEEK